MEWDGEIFEVEWWKRGEVSLELVALSYQIQTMPLCNLCALIPPVAALSGYLRENEPGSESGMVSGVRARGFSSSFSFPGTPYPLDYWVHERKIKRGRRRAVPLRKERHERDEQ